MVRLDRTIHAKPTARRETLVLQSSRRMNSPVADRAAQTFTYQMEDTLSDRTIEQRRRNRIMEALETLAMGDEAVRQMGPSEYFEQFYDWIRHRDDGAMWPNSAVTLEERVSLATVSGLLDDACDATSRLVGIDELIESGWPKRIQPFAQAALDAMLRRGRFSEDREELHPYSSAQT